MQQNGVRRKSRNESLDQSQAFRDFQRFSVVFSGQFFAELRNPSSVYIRVINMNKKISQINRKCGYCGWILPINADPLKHTCFNNDYFAEHNNVLIIDENNIVTIGNKTNDEMEDQTDQTYILDEQTQGTEATVDEILIACVSQKPALYDHRLPLSERTMLKKNALWNEVCNVMRGTMNVNSVKKRWKYLKDCYMKDKKKRNEYVASGSASTSKRKSTFRFSETMSFLSDSMEPRPTSSTLSSTLSSTNEGGPPTPRDPSPIEPVSSAPLHVSTVNTHNASASPASNFSNKTNENSSKRKKSDSTKNEKDPLEEAFIAAVIKEPEGKDSVHHFVMRLAEGL